MTKEELCLAKEELHLDLLKHFPEFSGKFLFVDDIPVISGWLLIIQDFSTSEAEGNMKVSFAFELGLILEKKTLANKCWITTQTIREGGPKHYPDYKKFKHKEDVFYPYSVKFGKYAGKVSAETLRIICTNIYDENITK